MFQHNYRAFCLDADNYVVISGVGTRGLQGLQPPFIFGGCITALAGLQSCNTYNYAVNFPKLNGIQRNTPA